MEFVYCALGNRIIRHRLQGNEPSEWKVPGLPVKAEMMSWNDKLLFVGGFVNGRLTRSIFIWDEFSGLQTLYDIPMTFNGHAAVIFEDQLYIFGGADGRLSRVACRVDLSSKDFVLLEQLSSDSKFLSAVVIRDTIYLLGGNNGSQLFIYDPKLDKYSVCLVVSDKWLKRTRMIKLSERHILMFGGVKDSELAEQVVVLDTLSTKAITISKHFRIAPEIYSGTCQILNNTLYIGTARGHKVVVSLIPLYWELKLLYGDVYWRARRGLVFVMKYGELSHRTCSLSKLSRSLAREMIEFI
mmetsp:Transcript_20162/g.37519  ORF Transcript_20162/g.37519 Transcript_20162/m.37519 type:complete len:298 (-) Transcript_20162:6561-7454(-)